MLRVDDAEVTMTDDYCYRYQGQPFTGIAVRTLHGRRVSEVTYRDGTPHGLQRQWDYEEGYLRREACHLGNTVHGIEQQWYEYGQRKSLAYIEHGICLQSITWNQFGDRVATYVLQPSDSRYGLLEKYRIVYDKPLHLSDEEAKEQAQLRRELAGFLEAEGF